MTKTFDEFIYEIIEECMYCESNKANGNPHSGDCVGQAREAIKALIKERLPEPHKAERADIGEMEVEEIETAYRKQLIEEMGL